MKKTIAAIMTAALVLGLAACGGSGGSTSQASGGDAGTEQKTEASGDVIRIGVFEPSTGDSASGGKKETLGM